MRAISFASESHYAMQDRWYSECRDAGMDDVVCYREKDIPSDFVKFGDRGYGFWQWKPLFIERSLRETDKVLYMDVDYSLLEPWRLEALLDISDLGVVLFRYSFPQRIWCKRDAFVFMGCDEQRYWDADHLEAGISLWRATSFAKSTVKEWAGYAKQRAIISDDPNVGGEENFPEFRDHRHDQAILTNLKTQYDLNTLPVKFLKGIIAGADI
jgi:hypothetical protein